MDHTGLGSASSSMEILFYPGCLDSVSRSEEETITIDNAPLVERDIITLLFTLLERHGLKYHTRIIDNDVRFDRAQYTSDVANVIVVPSYYLYTKDVDKYKTSIDILKKSQFLNAPFTGSNNNSSNSFFTMFFLIECDAESLAPDSIPIPISQNLNTSFITTQSQNTKSTDDTSPEAKTDTKPPAFWSLLCVTCHNINEPYEVFFISPLEHKPINSSFETLFQTFPEQVRDRLTQYISQFGRLNLDLSTCQVKYISIFKQRDYFNGGIVAALNIAWVLKMHGRISESVVEGSGLFGYEEQRVVDQARALLGFSYRRRIRERRKRTTRCYDFEEDEVINFEPSITGTSSATTNGSSISNDSASHINGNSWAPAVKRKLNILPSPLKNSPILPTFKNDYNSSSNTKSPGYRNGQPVSRYLSAEARACIGKVFEMLSIENVVKKDVFPALSPSRSSLAHTTKFAPVKAQPIAGPGDSSSTNEELANNTMNGTETSNELESSKSLSSESLLSSTSNSTILHSMPDSETLRLLSNYIQNFDFITNFCPDEAKHFSLEELGDLRGHFLKKVAFPSAFFETLVNAGDKAHVTKDTILAGIRKTIESIEIPDSFTPDATLADFLQVFGKSNIKELFLMDEAMTYETTKLGRNKKLLCKYRDPLHYDFLSGKLELKYRKGDASETKPRFEDSHIIKSTPQPINTYGNADGNTTFGTDAKLNTIYTHGNSNNSHAGSLRQGELLVSALDISCVADYALQMFDDRQVPKPSKYVPQALQSLARKRYYTTTKALMKVFNNHFTRNELLPGIASTSATATPISSSTATTGDKKEATPIPPMKKKKKVEN